MPASPDPISEPQAYQEHLIGLVGTDDPAEVQTATPERIRALLANAGPDARTRPEPSEWSVLECIAHIADAEVVYSGRYRWILAHDEPDLIGYDQDLWVGRLHQPVEEPGPMLQLFEALRAANLALWKRTPAEQRERVGLHRERGPESYGLSFTLIAGHDRFHLDQAARALAQVRGGCARSRSRRQLAAPSPNPHDQHRDHDHAQDNRAWHPDDWIHRPELYFVAPTSGARSASGWQ